MCVFMHVYLYIDTYIYIHIYVNINIHLHIYMYILLEYFYKRALHSSALFFKEPQIFGTQRFSRLLVFLCCSVLQCAAVSSSVLQCVAVCCSVLQCVAGCYRVCMRRQRFSRLPVYLFEDRQRSVGCLRCYVFLAIW